MGYIASQGQLNREVLKRALFYGGVMGSFAVECFGPERLTSLTRDDVGSGACEVIWVESVQVTDRPPDM